ncbi:hypothetical protein [Mycobacterium sp. ST-F2]|uniref:hypothetical protein n=1 Tax=Mycobacterium sp. ST-F2 TaxID=1490484 RepID=UPI00114FE1E4|nr:hypothetical protein [Mycobacterium sp. ST-F2]
MTQSTMMAAPVPPSAGESVQLLVAPVVTNDPSPDIALFAEVDAILCEAAATLRRRPAPPAIGCALDEPRCAGRPWHSHTPRPRNAPATRVYPMQRSPPQRRDPTALLMIHPAEAR